MGKLCNLDAALKIVRAVMDEENDVRHEQRAPKASGEPNDRRAGMTRCLFALFVPRTREQGRVRLLDLAVSAVIFCNSVNSRPHCLHGKRTL